ncbi:hypothetical protein HU200_059659 [Digitaria exilis]|uniref:SAP domain-containing protein n=1 Tax=Digitaria exilis TaxID=1010633 RepID=A0A835AB62_9POAL|nr:hypothetical protein HU200_059659 [Digitaria exilis]
MDFGGMKRPELQALCKRHGLPAGGTNADLVARLDAALSGGAEAEEEVVVGMVTRKGCLKRPVGDGGEAKKVTFAVQQTRGRRLRSRVVWSPVVSKTRGKRAEAGADSAADDGISVDACANVPVRRSRRNSLTAADAEEIEAAVTVDRKRKCKDQEIAEDVAANAQVVPSRRVTRRSSLSGNAVLLPPAVEKKMGREKAADGKNKLAAEEQVAEAQDSSAATTVVENKRSRRKRENCDPDVQKSAKVEAPSRTTRSRSVEAALMSPTVVENKRRKTGDGQPDVELPTVSEVVKKDAPVTRSLRNRVVQVNNSVVEETRTSQQLENKAQPSRPATRRHKQVESSVEEEDQEQVAVPNKAPLSRRSGRNNSEASNANSENNKLVSALVEAKDLQPAITEPVRRSTRKSVVSTMLDSEDKDPTEEKNPEAPVMRSMRRSVVPAKDVKGAGQEIQHAKGEDAVKQPAITEPVRKSTRKSLASAMHEKEENDLSAEKNPGAHVRRSSRKSVVPVKNVGMEESEAGTRKPKVRDHGVAMVISGNDSQAVLQRSTGKSSNHYLSDDNETQPGSEKCMSHESVGEDVMKLRNHRRSSMEISSSAKDSSNIEDFSGQKFRKQQRSQTPIEKGDTGANYDRQLRTQQASHSTTSKERSSKRRWTTAPEEVTSAEEANDVMVIREATEYTCKVSHEYCEPSSRIQEICQANATGEEYSSGPSLGTVTLPDEICTTQSVHEAIPGSESSEAAKESLDKSKQPQEHTAIQHDDNHLSETRNEELDQSSSVSELHSGFVLEDKTLMGEGSIYVLPAEFAVGDGEGQSPVAGHGSDTASGSAIPTSDNNPEIHCDVITEESIRADDLGRCPSMDGKGNLLTNLHSEGAADNSILPALNAAKGCSSDERHSSFGLEVMFTEASKDTAVEVDGGNKSITCLTPGFHVGSYCDLEDEDVTKEEVVTEWKSFDEHAAAKTDLKSNLNCEFTGIDMDSDCSIAEKNMRLVADKTDEEEATIPVQQDGVQEGDPEKPSLFSATPKCKRECGLPEETVLQSKNQGCSSSAEQSPFGIESLLSQESIEKSVEYDALAASVHTEIGFDELKECHVKRALENAHVSKPHHDTDEGSCPVSKTDDFMCTSQQGNGIEAMRGTNSEEVACKGEGSDKLVHCDDPEPSSEKTDVNEQAPDNAYGVSDVVLSSTLHAPANENYDACLGSNIGLTHQGHKDQCSEDTEKRFASKTLSNDIFEGATSKYIECGDVLLPAEERSHSQDDQLNSKLEGTKVVESGCNFSKDFSSDLDNGSVVGIVGERTPPGSSLPKDLSTEYNTKQEHLDGPSAEIFRDGSTTYRGENVSRVGHLATSSKHDGALSEEAVRTMKKYAGTCSSNPRELLMDLQSPLSKEKIEGSISHDGLAFPSAKSSGNESVDVEQRVEVHLGSNMSQLESTDLLDELIGCSKTEMLHQGHNDRCSEDREEQVAVVDIVGQRTPSGSGLQEDYCTDYNPQQDFLDGCSVESSLQGSTTVCWKKNVSAVAGTIENPSFSIATTDYKHDGALSEEAAHKLKKYTGTCSEDPKHLVIELQSLFSEASIETSVSHDDLAFPSAESGINEPTVCHFEKPVDTLVSSEPDTYQGRCHDLSRAEEKESCMSASVQHNESGGFLRSSHMKDLVTSAHINLSDDAHLIERNIVVEEVLCEAKEKGKSFPTSDSDVLQSNSNEYGPCQTGQQCVHESSSMQATSNIEAFNHDHEESNENNGGQITPGIPASNMSEDADIERSEREIGLPLAAGISALPDEQLKHPGDLSAPRTPEESIVLQNYCFPGSEGIILLAAELFTFQQNVLFNFLL